MNIAFGFQELDGDSPELRNGEVIALVRPILKHGGGAIVGVFEPQNLVLEVVYGLANKFFAGRTGRRPKG